MKRTEEEWKMILEIVKKLNDIAEQVWVKEKIWTICEEHEIPKVKEAWIEGFIKGYLYCEAEKLKHLKN